MCGSSVRGLVKVNSSSLYSASMKSSVTPTLMLKFERWPSTAFSEVFGHLSILVDQLTRLLQGVREGVVREVVGVVQAQRVSKGDVLVLRVDELDDDVRVRDAHDAHLGPAARAALRDRLAHLVERTSA